MSYGANKAFLIGNVGKDPVIRTHNENKYAAFNLATSTYEKGAGDKNQRTDWHNVNVRNQALVDVVEQYVKKGSKVCVEGEIQTRKYEDKTGVERYITEIVVGFKGAIHLLDRKEGGGGGQPAPAREYNDDIPFVTADEFCILRRDA